MPYGVFEKMKRFLIKLLGVVPIFIVIIFVNFRVDPANIFKKDYERKAAEILLSGQSVVGMDNYDERILQEEIIRRIKETPDAIIIGSSRVMTLSDEVIGNEEEYWNHGVSGAGIPDYLGILGIYDEYSELPGQVIIGLDPWILNDNSGDTRYQSIAKYVDRFRKKVEGTDSRIQLERNSFEKEMQLVSLSYFQSAFHLVTENPELLKKSAIEFYGTNKKDVEDSIRYTDGSIEYNKAFRERSAEDTFADAKTYVSQGIYQIENYQMLSMEKRMLFEKMIDYLQKDGVDVIFYLPPYHPYVYEYIKENKNYEMVLEVERYFRKIAEGEGIKLYGSYNPETLDCVEEDFLDGMHMKRECISKSWKQVSNVY